MPRHFPPASRSPAPSAPTSITGGTGNDTIDGGGGADVIAGGLGDDTVTYHGTELSIDGGTGIDTLMVAAGSSMTAVNFSLAAGTDQTTGDSVLVTNFENLDASALSSALTVTGSSAANVITTGGGNDTIDGGGGGDVISAGAGNDTVSYYGTEISIDGGTGINTLVLRAATTVSLGNLDQTTGDTTSVAQLSERRCIGADSGGLDHRFLGRQRPITGGSGDDTIDGAGGADSINAGAGNDTVIYHGTETTIDGGADRTRWCLRRPAASRPSISRSLQAPTRPPATPSSSPISRTSMPR